MHNESYFHFDYVVALQSLGEVVDSVLDADGLMALHSSHIMLLLSSSLISIPPVPCPKLAI